MQNNINASILGILEGIQEKLSEIQQALELGVKPFMDVHECSIYTNLSKAQIYFLTSKRLIKFQKIGKRCYFSREVVDAYFLDPKNTVHSDKEIHVKAVTALMSGDQSGRIE